MFSLIKKLICLCHDQSFRASLCSSSVIKYLKISENMRNKSYESITHNAVKPKTTNYKYMQPINYTVYNG